MISLALKTLLNARGKLATGLAGVVFSLVLVNIQGGLFLGLMKKASVLIDDCDADLWVGHRNLENVDFANDIPTAWQNRIRGLPEVARVDEYIVGKGIATLPDGGYEDVWVIGSDPATMRGSGWEFAAGALEDLRRPNGVSIDEVDAHKLGNIGLGDWIEVNGRRAKVVALTRGITGFVTTPYLFTTLNTARGLARIPEGYCSYLLIKTQPSANIALLKERIRELLPDADVYSPAHLSEVSQRYWMRRTGIGVSFGMATLLGVLVGLLMVAQSLYALALDHLDDYATLKAIGADDRQVCRVVVVQALSIAGGGVVAGLAIVAAVERLWNSPLAPIEIPPLLRAATVAFVVGMCLAAALFPFWRVRGVDPAVVLQG
ncbi:MAG: ABC transporter permease [Planctomycetaceae bacterium]